MVHHEKYFIKQKVGRNWNACWTELTRCTVCAAGEDEGTQVMRLSDHVTTYIYTTIPEHLIEDFRCSSNSLWQAVARVLLHSLVICSMVLFPSHCSCTCKQWQPAAIGSWVV